MRRLALAGMSVAALALSSVVAVAQVNYPDDPTYQNSYQPSDNGYQPSEGYPPQPAYNGTQPYQDYQNAMSAYDAARDTAAQQRQAYDANSAQYDANAARYNDSQWRYRRQLRVYENARAAYDAEYGPGAYESYYGPPPPPPY